MDIGANQVIRSYKTASTEFHLGHYQSCLSPSLFCPHKTIDITFEGHAAHSHSQPLKTLLLSFFFVAAKDKLSSTHTDVAEDEEKFVLVSLVHSMLRELISQVRSVL